MKKLHVLIKSEESAPLFRLAKGALEAEASRRGIQLNIDAEFDKPVFELAAIAQEKGGAVIVSAAKIETLVQQHAGGQVVQVALGVLARETREVIGEIFPEAIVGKNDSKVVVDKPAVVETSERFLVGVTSCPTGIAHTFMAAEALQRGAKALGYTMKVETRGSVGAKNELTADEIARADAVIVAADATVETKRFAGKRLLETGTKAAIKDSPGLINEALAMTPSTAAGAEIKAGGAVPKKARTGLYKHLMTGVSNMLPLVTAGGLLIALAFAIGGINAGDAEGTFGAALMSIGGGAAFALFIPVLAGFISFSIADRPGLAPGLIGGMLAAQLGAGFLGGLAAGFFAGYFTAWLNKSLKLPDSLAGLKPVLILPLISALVVGLGMIYVIGPPVKIVLDALTAWLSGMQESSAIVLGLLLGGMMAFDMGGPVNKSAYTFSVGLLASQVYGPMAAVMAAGMVPPLAVAAAAMLFKNRFTADEQQASKSTAILGISFITEGAIPYAAADPLRVIPSLILGSAVTGALSMVLGCTLLVPHGGIFVLAIPNAITHILGYVTAIIAGTAVSIAALYFVKRPLEQN